ncbi:hypothetical protein ACFFRR_011667 [Megaselia abdita]
MNSIKAEIIQTVIIVKMNPQGKNIVLLGGLQGLGLSLAKNLLMKRISNLYIIDCIEDQNILQGLRSEWKGTNIMFARMDLLNLNLEELHSLLLKINLKMQHIDLFINGLEILMDKDLQRSMNLNMNLYLNMMLIMRDIMDKKKGGRGGMIINLLSILGLQNGLNLQQYLINKQMLLSLTEALAQDIRYLQSGVQIMALMPNINQKNMLRNMDWIKGIGLQNLILDWNRGRDELLRNDIGEDLLLGLRDDILGDNILLGQDLHRDDLRRDQRRRQRILIDDDLHRDRLQRIQNRGLLLNDDWHGDQVLGMDRLMLQDDLLIDQGQRLEGLSLDGRRMLDLLARNMINAIEKGRNGMLLLVGLQSLKNLQNDMQLSRL